jgi:hypothetical protein
LPVPQAVGDEFVHGVDEGDEVAAAAWQPAVAENNGVEEENDEQGEDGEGG